MSPAEDPDLAPGDEGTEGIAGYVVGLGLAILLLRLVVRLVAANGAD